MIHPAYSIFPNGTSHMVWRERNCDRCIKGPKEDAAVNESCAIEQAISMAAALDGTLLHCGDTPLNKADTIAKRLNWDGKSYLQNDCPEFVP